MINYGKNTHCTMTNTIKQHLMQSTKKSKKQSTKN